MNSKVINVILIFSVLLLSFTTSVISAQSKEWKPMELVNGNMKKTKFKKLLKACSKADVIFIGEMHNDPISHWIENKMVKEMHQNGGIVLGLEMFEKDRQEILTSYLAGEVDEATLEAEGDLWNNYKTDYRPIIEYAKENKIKVVASNIPRKYAALVNKQGLEVLEGMVKEEKKMMAPLPIDFDENTKINKAIMEVVKDHGTISFLQAQAIKDATMAHSIAENLESGKKFIHINGSFHSDYHEGIIWYLNKYKPGLNIVTIKAAHPPTNADEKRLLKNSADFILLVDKDVTTSY